MKHPSLLVELEKSYERVGTKTYYYELVRTIPFEKIVLKQYNWKNLSFKIHSSSQILSGVQILKSEYKRILFTPLYLPSGSMKYSFPRFEPDETSFIPYLRIHIELTAEDPALLVISESSYPGWKVFVDGKEEEWLWLNLLYQGVEIDRGKHKIEFIYHPKNFSVFLLISLCAMAAFLIAWLFHHKTGLWGFSN